MMRAMRFAHGRDGSKIMIERTARLAAMAGVAMFASWPVAVPARDVLGVFEHWGAFRDPDRPRCFAIAQPVSQLGTRPSWYAFVAIGYWPRQGVRGQINIRLSHELASGAAATLRIGPSHFALTGGGADVWAKDKRDDAAILAAIRSGRVMSVQGRARDGTSFVDSYALRGAATAIDAAALGCARIR